MSARARMPSYRETMPYRDPIRVCPGCHKRRQYPAEAPVCIECQARAAKPTAFQRRAEPSHGPAIEPDDCPATEPSACYARAKEIRDAQIDACRRQATYELLRDFRLCCSLSTARLLWELLKAIGIDEDYPNPRKQCPACHVVGAYVGGAISHCRLCGHTTEAVDGYTRPMDGTGLAVKANQKRLARISPLDLPFER